VSSAGGKVVLCKIMIESLQRENRAFTILRRQGDQSKFDIAAFASELPRSQEGDEPLSLLFEWSQVSSWPFEAPSAVAIRDWKKSAPRISRAAVVHDHRLNRHAAILAALMRVDGSEVKSFHPPAYDSAVAWLAGEARLSPLDGHGFRRDQKGD
jgi:hypothetical protein